MKFIFAIIGFTAAGAIFFFYTKPAYDGMHTYRAQIAQYNSALDKAAELQQLKQTLLSRYNAINPNLLDRLQKMLPDHVDNISLILDLDNLASTYGLALENVYVSAPTNSASAATPVGAIGTANQKYDSLTIKFSTTGSYENFLQFLTDLESSLRIVDLVSLSLSANSLASSQGASDSIYTYNITLRTYWLK